METPEEGGAKAGTFYLLGNIRSGPEGRVEGEGQRGVGTEDGPGNGRFLTTSKGEERRQAAHETHRTKRRWEHGPFRTQDASTAAATAASEEGRSASGARKSRSEGQGRGWAIPQGTADAR